MRAASRSWRSVYFLASDDDPLALENDDVGQNPSPGLNSLGRVPFIPPLQTVNVSRSSL